MEWAHWYGELVDWDKWVAEWKNQWFIDWESDFLWTSYSFKNNQITNYTNSNQCQSLFSEYLFIVYYISSEVWALWFLEFKLSPWELKIILNDKWNSIGSVSLCDILMLWFWRQKCRASQLDLYQRWNLLKVT